MSFPPHLPPPTSSIARHRLWMQIKVILVSAFFGLLAGLTGAAVFLAWIWPPYGGGDSWIASSSQVNVARQRALEQAQTRVDDKLFAIYARESVNAGQAYLKEADFLGQGVVAVSSGWLVAYVPNHDTHYKDWQVLGSTGSLYTVERALEDKHSGLVFLKIARSVESVQSRAEEQLKAAVFAEPLSIPTPVAVRHRGAWFTSAVVAEAGATFKEAHLDTAEGSDYIVADAFDPGDVVVDDQGNVIGFVQMDREVMPVFAVANTLLGIDEKNAVTYPSLGIEGWYSSEQPIVVAGERVTGFLVMRTTSAKSLFKKGDIVEEVNGRPATFRNVWYTIGAADVRVKIVRNGKEQNFTVPVVQM